LILIGASLQFLLSDHDSRTIDYEKAILVVKAEYIFGLNKNGADDQIFIRVSVGDASRISLSCHWLIEKSVCTNANAARACIDVTPLCARYKRKNFDFVELRACARANSEGIARACAKPWSYLVLASAKNIYKISFDAERRCPLACR
jgi:hypothetical protein